MESLAPLPVLESDGQSGAGQRVCCMAFTFLADRDAELRFGLESGADPGFRAGNVVAPFTLRKRIDGISPTGVTG